MAKLKSSLLNMFLSLTLICVFAAGILAGVNYLTTGPIEASRKAKLENAIKEVVPEFDNSPSEEAYNAAIPSGDSLKVYPAKKNGELVGVAVESYSMQGFSGEIKVMVGFDLHGKLLNYTVLHHAETPGLGSKMESWFRTDKNRQNIIGRDLSTQTLKVSKDGGDVDAITAATISSRAFLDAVNRAAAFSGGNDAVSGASTPASESSDGVSSATPKATEQDTTQIKKGGIDE